MKTLLIAAAFSSVAISYVAASQAQEPAADPLDEVNVQGQRQPWDSHRPEYDRMLPCIGCDEPEAKEDVIVSLLRYALLPSEPPDNRAYTPISLQQPRNPRADKLP